MIREAGYFKTNDGTHLFYRAWYAQTDNVPVLIIHGLHEHSGRYESIIERLNLPNSSFFSFDQRGHGLSEGKRGYALSTDQFLDDIDCFWNFALTRWPSFSAGRVILYGHSFGGLWGIRYGMRRPDRIKAAVFSSPCLSIRSWVPYLDRLVASLAPFFPKAGIHSFVYSNLLSHDPEARKLHHEDPLIHNQIGLMLLRDALKIMPETVKRASEFTSPLLLLVSGTDYVVEKEKTFQFFARAGIKEKYQHVFPDFYHELLRESDWEKPISLMRDFLLKYSREGTV